MSGDPAPVAPVPTGAGISPLRYAVGIGLNLAIVGGEAFAALAGNSMALLADAGHNLTDVLGLALAGGAAWLALRPASSKRTYGYRRATILASLANGVILFAMSAALAWEGVTRLLAPERVSERLVMAVAGVAVLANVATVLLFLPGRHRDLNVRAVILHMSADAALSLGVILAGLGILATGWQWLDPAMSLVIVAAIVWSTWGLLRESFDLSLDAVPRGIDPGSVREYLLGLPGVADVHHLHVWAMSTTETALTAHVVKPDGVLDDALLARVRRELADRFGIGHVALQLESGRSDARCAFERGVARADPEAAHRAGPR